MKQMVVLSALLVSTSLYNMRTQAGCGGECPVVSPLPDVGLSQTQEVQINLDAYVMDSDTAVEDLDWEITSSGSEVTAEIDASSHELHLTGSATLSGETTVGLRVTDPDGCSDEATLRVQVHANRSCTTVFSYDARAYGAVSSIYAAGQFNGWSANATPMTDPDGDGVYTSAALSLQPGWVQYKFVTNGGTWILDPGNSYTAWDGGFENSELEVPDCRQPLLTLEELSVDGATGSLDAVVSYTDGSAGEGPVVSSLQATAGSLPVDVGFDDYSRTLNIHLTGLEPDKYSLRVNASSADGYAADMLFVPAWIESSPFDWHDASLYFAFIDRFDDGKTSNDAPIASVPEQSNYQGGDWAGLKAKIDSGYFDSMGINTLWISPQQDNIDNAEYGDDGRLYSGYHGYWPKDPDADESRFGSSQELKDLIATAHAHGIRVLFDLVANHVHNQHPYYAQHSDDGWFNDYALCKDGNNWNDIPITCWFAPYLPDIDYQNPDALHTLAQDALEYIKTYDIDGYRVDAVKHMEKSYLYHLATDVERYVEHGSTAPEDQFYLVGETFVGTWSTSCDNTSSCAQWLMNEYIGPHMLDGQFDFPLYWQVLETFGRYETSISDLETMCAQSEDYYGDDAIMSSFLGNHDVARYVSHANGDIADMWGNGAKEQAWTNPPAAPTTYPPYQKLQLGFTFLATTKGVPLVYYGDDIGMPGAGDPDNRRFMRFGSDLSSYESQTLAYVQKLFTVRGQHPALRSSNRVPLLSTDADVYVYGRIAGSEKGVVALNRGSSSRTVTVNVTGMGLSSGKVLTDALAGGTVTVSGSSLSITLPAYTAAIYF